MEIILLIGALIVTWLVFTWLVKVVKASVKTAVAIAAVVLILQLAFGISFQDLWATIQDLFSNIFGR
ncbi:MAG: hypothetical protein HC838_08380 [Spirulinaceae cyanobacterium RM2_2_10]|nr:hypothetical protein [Spirulinaceae cyanobacterium SM2_1_0]NJO20059.1 hypothetical protein [Spirulinaceae cyanobacterium RM2_2_10]